MTALSGSRNKPHDASRRSALQQIEDKQYAADLITRGIAPDRIRKYGFAPDIMHNEKREQENEQ